MTATELDLPSGRARMHRVRSAPADAQLGKRTPPIDAREAPKVGLLGRVEERETLNGLLRATRSGHGGVVVLRGEPGIGKSALLDDLSVTALDCLLCGAIGVESEMELAYAGLQQLCGSMMDLLVDLPTPRRSALEKVFGLDTGSPPDRFLVGMAVLDLLTVAAQRQPVVWIIDDAQWLDRCSLWTIGFVGRRLHTDRILIAIASRDIGDDDEIAGLPVLQLAGLNPEDAGALFDSVVSGPTDRAVRERIIAETRGNPLALLELPRTWTSAEAVEGLPESAGLPLTGHIELAFAKRLSELPSDTQTLLALAAAEPTGDMALLWSAAQKLGLDLSAAAPAERAGLIEFVPRVHFRHPLVRAVAYRATPLRKRLDVHRALADVTDSIRDPDRRAWHRASSTVTHDEDIASELEHAAGRAKARGGLFAAASLLERAALLTPDGPRRSNRTLAAAKAKRDAGALDAALRLLPGVESEPPSELRGALAEQLRGRIAFDQRHGTEAAELLLSAAQRLERFDRKLARETHLEALTAAVWASGPDSRELIHKAAKAALAAPPGGKVPRPSDLLLDSLALRATEGYEAAAPALTLAVAAVRNHDLGADDVDTLMWLAENRFAGIIAIEVWDHEAGLEFAERQVRVAREAGALVQLQFALNFLANNVLLTGDTRTAAALVEEERLLSTMTRVPVVGYSSMMLAAMRGDAVNAVPMIESTIDNATANGQGRIVAFALYVSAVLYNGLGRHAEALDCARKVVEGGVLGYQTLAAIELAEAASRNGDTELLADVSGWIRARADATPTGWALGIAARAQAFAADDADADRLYRESIEHLGKTSLRVELAKSHLVYGEWLRRRGLKADAREQLATAHDAFTEMGIAGLANRARRELTATTGRRTARFIDFPSMQLTGQEALIAELAQQGLSNREIGGRLFLSPRTVEWHLRNIFGKIGVSSRRELRAKALGPYLPSDQSEIQ
jgi:DNA-binding CsgD family transcriptional regulator